MALPNTHCIIVGTNGFVWYTTQAVDEGDYIYLADARGIRNWGTDQGLAQLVNGPTKDTVLDARAAVVLAKSAFLFAIPCVKWNL